MTSKKIYLIIVALFATLFASAQLIATVQMKQPVQGICNQNEVYALFGSFKGQVEATSSLSKQQIEEQLNKIDFIINNPKYKGNGMVGCYINCKNEALIWDISVTTKNTDLDKQILEVFKAISGWKSGTLDGKNVDTRILFSYKIKKGHLTLN